MYNQCLVFIFCFETEGLANILVPCVAMAFEFPVLVCYTVSVVVFTCAFGLLLNLEEENWEPHRLLLIFFRFKDYYC